MNINLIKAIDNCEDYSCFYKDLNKLVLYKGDFITLSSPLKVAVAKFGLEILNIIIRALYVNIYRISLIYQYI
ncbi:hypothetical protein C8034_v001552 [Colletotrichum sidae]|uniref:Uncharacterized protein n=1 Tax=Colletotrichum sidae TaxID=1347389 RepID=A0A4R8SUS2_9PEZI|nr:hypothetical protein C8034_v001552 [Colletotrichum sidae]